VDLSPSTEVLTSGDRFATRCVTDPADQNFFTWVLSPSDGVLGSRCEVRTRIAAANEETPEERRVTFRIGIHVGEVMVPAYLEHRPMPLSPQDLADHQCINQRWSRLGSLYQWDFEKDGREVRVSVEGQLIFNDEDAILQAALEGFGLAFVMEDYVTAAIADGRLVRVLDDWCPPFAGYHLYYPSRRQPSAAFKLIVDALRHRG
jgi:DNA-binding transcriptional LysR family regulator